MKHLSHQGPIETSPDIVARVSPDDDIGFIRIMRDPCRTRITSIGWAVLKVDDRLISGSIDLEWPEDLAGPVDRFGEYPMYYNAAATLNACLNGSVVHDTRFYGSHGEDRMYQVAGMKPTWRRTTKQAIDIYKELVFELGAGVSFRPRLPLEGNGTLREFAVRRLDEYRTLRRFFRASSQALVQSTRTPETIDHHGAAVKIVYAGP